MKGRGLLWLYLLSSVPLAIMAAYAIAAFGVSPVRVVTLVWNVGIVFGCMAVLWRAAP